MVLARVADQLLPSSLRPKSDVNQRTASHTTDDAARSPMSTDMGLKAKEEEEEDRPAYIHATFAGGIGGLAGDMLMHSLDTVKTRQQGDPHRPPKYATLANTYNTIWRQEGLIRGLYGGVAPAAVGSFGGTCIFFGSYEWSKRQMIDRGMAPSVAYLAAGLVADLLASPWYVPTEVLKTRLQLQGRYNNPHFASGYNYRSTINATRAIYKAEGLQALFYGYRATLYRDLPFSALQFAFYEKERNFAKWWAGSNNIGLPLEILVGATAGGAAGTMTCPLDVVKTRIQTQVNPPEHSSATTSCSNRASSAHAPASRQSQQVRHVSTQSPIKPGSARLDTSSILTGLKIIHRTEGIGGWFRGVGPRATWTSIQSSMMFVLYQTVLRKFEEYVPVRD